MCCGPVVAQMNRPAFDLDANRNLVHAQTAAASNAGIAPASGMSGSRTALPQSGIERVVPCFTPGTAIATPRGERMVETLVIGDRVVTRDNGLQRITWVGERRLDLDELKASPELRPIAIKAGALGNNQPERDMLVSPSHRMLIVSELAQLYFGQSEVLVAAKHLIALHGVEVSNRPYVTYIHFMCENHEIVLSDGTWSESFQPADHTLKGFDQAQRDELFILFPQLATKEGLAEYRAARRSLKNHEAALLFKDERPATPPNPAAYPDPAAPSGRAG